MRIKLDLYTEDDECGLIDEEPEPSQCTCILDFDMGQIVRVLDN